LPDLDGLRLEYSRQGLTQGLYDTVRKAVAAFVWVRRPPSWRGLDGRWDADAILALTDDLLIGPLSRSKLGDLLTTASNLSEFEKGLEHVVGDHLRRTTGRGPLGNLKEQIIRALEASTDFVALSKRGRRREWVWGLAKWEHDAERAGDAANVGDAVRFLRTMVRPRYGPSAGKRPPAIRPKDLKEFLAQLFESTGEYWVLKDIMYLIADTVGLTSEGTYPVPDLSWVMGQSVDPLDMVEHSEARGLALRFFVGCSPPEKAILRGLASEMGNLDMVAQGSGLSKATVSRRSRALLRRLHTACGEPGETQAVWHELMDVAVDTEV
jgi:hypothetical protein